MFGTGSIGPQNRSRPVLEPWPGLDIRTGGHGELNDWIKKKKNRRITAIEYR